MQDGWYYIKTWGQMKEEFGIGSTCAIACAACFTQAMEKSLPPHRCIEVRHSCWKNYAITDDMIASPCYAIGEDVMVRDTETGPWMGRKKYEGYTYDSEHQHSAGGGIWRYCKRFEPKNIEITCTINGEPVKLS